MNIKKNTQNSPWKDKTTIKSRVDRSIIQFGAFFRKVIVHQISPKKSLKILWKSLGVLLIEEVYCSSLYGKWIKTSLKFILWILKSEIDKWFIYTQKTNVEYPVAMGENHSIYNRTVSSWCLLSTLLIQFKLKSLFYK